MSNSTNKWYALYTKPGCEKKVANLLSRRNIENYCPLKRQWNGRKKAALEPLFNSFVFVQIGEAEISNIRMTDCVINFVYWLGKPAIIRDEYPNVMLEKIPFDVDGMVRLVDEPVTENKAYLVFVKDNTVKILLPSLGYMMLAEVEQSTVEIIATSTKQSFTMVEKYQYAV